MKNKEITDASTTKKIACLFCASRCGMLLHTRDGKLVKVEGDPENPVSRGWTCSQGRAAVVDRFKRLSKTL